MTKDYNGLTYIEWLKSRIEETKLEVELAKVESELKLIRSASPSEIRSRLRAVETQS